MEAREISGRLDRKIEPNSAFQIQDSSGQIEVRTGRTITRYWKKRSCLEKTLLILFILFIIIIIILSILVATKDTTEEKDSYCLTKECIVAAAGFIEALDQTTDPCKDFYQFSCGGFIKRNPLKDDSSNEDHFRKITDILQGQLLELIEAPANDSEDITAIYKLKIMYEVCQESDEISKSMNSNLNKFYKKFGGYPLLNSEWNEESITTEDVISTAIGMGLANALVTLIVEEDLYNTSIYRLTISQAGGMGEFRMSFRRRKRETDEINTNQFLLNLNKALGNTYDIYVNDTSSQDLKAIVDIYKAIAEHKSSSEMMRKNITFGYNKMTIEELTTLTDKKLDWLKIINNLFEGRKVIPESEEIIVVDLDYFTNLKNIFQNFNKRDIINYIISAVLIEITDYFYGEDEDSRCLDWTMHLFPFALARMYIDHNNLTNTKAEAKEMVDDIKLEVVEMVKKNRWMDDETRELVEEKVLAIVEKVAYPDWIMNNTQLNEFYSQINVTDNHFENTLAVLRDHVKKLFNYHGKVNDRKNPIFDPMEVNAFYMPTENSIILPMAILHKPLFESGRLAVLNFGAIGSIIGHEFFHSLDDTGRKFDKYGSLKQWWNDDMIELFENRTSCLVNQYNKYCPVSHKDENLCIDGKLTLGENIADNSGLRATFQAYQRWKRKHNTEKILPGLENFTPEQLFFISFGHLWCENIAAETVDLQDEHCPSKYRVIGSLSNSREFANVFQCESGLMNNAEDSCHLW